MWLAALHSVVAVAVVAVVGSLRLPVVGRLGRLLRLPVACVSLCFSLSLMSLLLMCVRCVIRHIYQAYSSVRQDSEEERKRCALNQKSQQKAKQSKAATTNWQQQLPTGNIGGNNRSGSVRQLNQPIRRQVQQLQPAAATLLSFPATLPLSLSLPLLPCSALLYSSRRVPHGVCAM